MESLARFLMTAFNPTISQLDPADRPDSLSIAVLHSLSRPIYGRIAWGPVKSFILGGISFGILPLLLWPRAFAKFVIAEQQQYWHFLEWLHIRTGDADAAELRDTLRNAAPPASLSLVPLVLIAIGVFCMSGMYFPPGFTIHHVLSISQPWLNDPFRAAYRPSHYLFGVRQFEIWTICLCIAYGAHWLHVRQHVTDINFLLRRLNPILVRQHLPPVPYYSVGLGLSPLWVIAGLVGFGSGAIWAIPAALAGAIHQRYCRRTSTRIRSELALRVSTALNRQRPAVDVPIPHGFRQVCKNQLCEQILPDGAAYCPRCGNRVPPPGARA